MAYIQDNEEFDPETLDILGGALDEAWQRVKHDHPEWQRLRRSDRACSAHFRHGQKG
jgi:hypothetical protein